MPPNSEKMNRLFQMIDAMGEEKLKLPRPTDDEFKLMSFYIQTYNFIELNGRRCLETLARAKFLKSKTIAAYRDVHDGELFKELKYGVKRMDKAIEDIPQSLACIAEIELRKDLRNKFAHYAARTIPNEDALLLLTKDNKISKKQFDEEIGEHVIVWAVVDVADVRGLCLHMQKYEIWIAKKAAEWFERYETPETIAELKAEERARAEAYISGKPL